MAQRRIQGVSEGSAQGGEEMKKIGEYTCKGRVDAMDVATDTPVRILLNDGQFTTGFRIVEFQVAPSAVDNTSPQQYVGKLSTAQDGSDAKTWDWDSNVEVAWAMCGFDGNASPVPMLGNWIDEDNLVIEDLYLYATEASDLPMNYIIKMDKYEFSDWRGALAMVRNRSQSDIS